MNGIETFRKLKPNELIPKLIGKIEEKLPLFSASDEFKDILVKRKHENQHSLSFCVFMSNNSNFNFQREVDQHIRSSVDIGVYFGSNLIFTIESKILPIPKSKISGPRFPYEYVYGKGGGIQRFKDGKHGLYDNDSFININGMIAFVKENDFTHWYSKVNQWILDAKWGKTEQLNKIYLTTTGKLVSSHKRVDGNKLTLHHFWVTV